MAKSGVPVVQQWQAGGDGGERVAIAPDRSKTADYQSPPWL